MDDKEDSTRGKKSKIIACEVAEIFNTEQMSIVIRYVDCLCEIREELIAFFSCKTGTTEETLSAKILSML